MKDFLNKEINVRPRNVMKNLFTAAFEGTGGAVLN
jgi:hypothetical protein